VSWASVALFVLNLLLMGVFQMGRTGLDGPIDPGADRRGR